MRHGVDLPDSLCSFDSDFSDWISGSDSCTIDKHRNVVTKLSSDQLPSFFDVLDIRDVSLDVEDLRRSFWSWSVMRWAEV